MTPQASTNPEYFWVLEADNVEFFVGHWHEGTVKLEMLLEIHQTDAAIQEDTVADLFYIIANIVSVSAAINPPLPFYLMPVPPSLFLFLSAMYV